MFHRFLKTCLFVGIAAALCPAQTTRIGGDNMAPIPHVGNDYIKMLSETVNPATGSVSLSIQLPVPKGRGLTLPYSITYDSSSVREVGVDSTDPYLPLKLLGYSIPAAFGGGSGWGDTFPYLTRQFENIGNNCTQSHGYMFRDRSGTAHTLSLGATGTGSGTGPCGAYTGPVNSGTASDGDIYGALQYCYPNSCSTGAPYVSFSERDGTTYYFYPRYTPTAWPIFELPYKIVDRNGNQITTQDTVNYTNTLGQVIPAPSSTTPDNYHCGRVNL